MNTLSTLRLALLAAAAAAPFGASAADRFVSSSGKDTNAGTFAAPWKTIQKAANSAKAGDSVFVRAGIYKERVQINVSGTASAPIVFSSYNSESVVLDETGVTPGNDMSAIIRIPSRNYVTIKGFELRNFRTALDTKVPVGILVDGACAGVQLLNNKIHHIEQNNAVKGNFDGNAHGIGVYGTAATAITGLVVDGNELSYLRLGASEALALNGNVTNFTVSNNNIHHANNIGIDVIGFEGTNANKSLDRARNGTIVGNTISAIDSSTNPAYNGDFTRGGGYLAVAGIYVDGGTQVIIERNQIVGCNYGIELASEAGNGKTDFVTVRDNVIRHNHLAGITLGGYDELRGVTENCTICSNTIYENDTTVGYTGQILFQFYARKNTISNNIIWANATAKQVIVHYPGSDSASDEQKQFSADNVFSYNLYYANGASTSNLSFELFNNGDFASYTLSTWQKSAFSGGDTGSNVTNPKFSTAVPSTSAVVAAFKPAAGSPAINSGSPSLASSLSEMDVTGGVRIKAGRIDRGAAEY